MTVSAARSPLLAVLLAAGLAGVAGAVGTAASARAAGSAVPAVDAVPADALEPIDAMAVIGDSKSAGILADTTVGAHLSPAAKAQMETLGALVKSLRKKRDGAEPSGGDDDTESNAETWYRIGWAFAHEGLNAFTGRKPYALRRRLSEDTGRRVVGFNEAVAAGSADTIALQLARIAADAARRAPDGTVDLFVLDVGAVDFVARNPPEAFAADYLAGLEAILAHNPRARVLVVKVPDPTRLLDFPDRVAFRFLLGKEMCSSVRVRLGFMDLVVEDMRNDPSGTRGRLAAMNAFLDTLPEWFAAHAPEARLALMDYPSVGPELSGVAADCFHPNEAGNAALAEAALPHVRALLSTRGDHAPRADAHGDARDDDSPAR